MVDYVDLIGVPFEYGARGPGAFDCWGLVMEMYRRAHGRDLPDFRSPTEQERMAVMGAMQMADPRWKEVPRQAGAVAAIRIGRLVSHCGFLLNEHTLIHAWQNSGGVTAPRTDEWERRFAGFYLYDN